jgi:hypothetical protein
MLQKNYIMFYNNKGSREKIIKLSEGLRGNFILVVTDVGEIICINLKTGKIEMKFNEPDLSAIPNNVVVLCKYNDPNNKNYTSRYIVNKDNMTTLQEVIFKDISHQASYFSKYGELNGPASKVKQIENCRGIRVLDPLRPIYISELAKKDGFKEEQLPRPIPCGVFLPKNNSGKYLAFNKNQKGPIVTDKRDEVTPLYIRPTRYWKKNPGEYEVHRINHPLKKGAEFVYNGMLRLTNDKKSIYPYDCQDTNCSVPANIIQSVIPKWECIDRLN